MKCALTITAAVFLLLVASCSKDNKTTTPIPVDSSNGCNFNSLHNDMGATAVDTNTFIIFRKIDKTTAKNYTVLGGTVYRFAVFNNNSQFCDSLPFIKDTSSTAKKLKVPAVTFVTDTIFTPDGDSISDSLKIKATGKFLAYKLYINNSAGDNVFSAFKNEAYWNGLKSDSTRVAPGEYKMVVQMWYFGNTDDYIFYETKQKNITVDY